MEKLIAKVTELLPKALRGDAGAIATLAIVGVAIVCDKLSKQ